MADGALPVHFQITTPGDKADLEARMARNDARRLPEAVQARCCVIVGSGPSARHDELWDFLDANPNMITVACNGALSLFVERGMAPTYWTCCDPQDMRCWTSCRPNCRSRPPTSWPVATKCPGAPVRRAGLVRRAPLAPGRHAGHDTGDCATYSGPAYEAGPCDCSVPDQLAVTCAVSVTLVTQSLMRFMGYHQFEMFGWDCCYLDGEHHASKQPRPIGCLPFVIEDEATETELHRFEVCPSWAAELHDACVQTHNLTAMGYKVNVHGPGAVAYRCCARSG